MPSPTTCITAAILCFATSAAFAHGSAMRPPGADNERVIRFPDTERYLTLVADLHTHSVFSDGHVWPRTRVEEALRDGLDAIAITEHLEWQPHRTDLPNHDLNRAWEIAQQAAEDTGLIVIRGSEITRRGPAGHLNAVFIEDANPLLQVSGETRAMQDANAFWDAAEAWPPEDALAAANAQDAFVFWNHPAWSGLPEGVPRPSKLQIDAFDNGLIHGIEVVNGHWYSEQAFRLALDHDLVLLGVSDIHELIDWDYQPHNGGHRPVTLILATERSGEGIREALFDGRTVVYFDNTVIGREPQLTELLDASLVVTAAGYAAKDNLVTVTFENRSDLRLLLENTSTWTFQSETGLVEIPPQSAFDLVVTTVDRLENLVLEFDVKNALVAPGTPASMTFDITPHMPERPARPPAE